MKNHPHIRILETYFFGYIARGIGAEETPLFTRTIDGLPLSNVIAEKFRVSGALRGGGNQHGPAGGCVVNWNIPGKAFPKSCYEESTRVSIPLTDQ